MKSLYLIYTILLIFGFQITFGQVEIKQKSNPQALVESNLPIMIFEKRHIELGKVKKGDNIRFSYTFTNKGKVDFAIDFISGCDCTELDWPVSTFKPGESGKIDVVFLSGKKKESETVEIDILLKNVHPQTNNPILEIISYSYIF